MSNTVPHKSVLGKGLASLLPGAPLGASTSTQNLSANPPVMNPDAMSGVAQAVATDSASARHMGISVLPIDQIKANEFQPRRDFDDASMEELAQSIRENGLIQPLIVRKNGNHYELIAGERRLRAGKMAGLKMVPVVIRKSTDREALELAIVENIQREDLNCVDEALAYFQLLQEFQLSQEELAKKMGKDRATVANSLRVLKLSDTIIGELKKGTLSRGHAKALLSVDDAMVREKLALEILAKNLSVRQTEKRAQEIKNPEQTAPTATKKIERHPILAQSTQGLIKRFMTKVDIKGDTKAGLIQFHYSSAEELNRLINMMMGQ